MKKVIVFVVSSIILITTSQAQALLPVNFQHAVEKLETAKNVRSYSQLEREFAKIAEVKKLDWLPWYYAALCNAKIGWLYKDGGKAIEPYLKRADAQLKEAVALLDTSSQKKELSELYCLFSMVYRVNFFLNSQSQHRQFGPTASQYILLARELDPSNPRALFLAGAEKYYRPWVWGGDKKKAKELLEMAALKLSKQADSENYPNWGAKEVNELMRKL